MSTKRSIWMLGAIVLGSALLTGAEVPSEASVDELLRAIESIDSEIATRGARDLEALCLRVARSGADRDREAISLALVKRLAGDLPPRVQAILLGGLAKVGGGEAVRSLATFIHPPNEPIVREAARRALEANPSVNAKRELRLALRTADGELRLGIIRSLGLRRDPLAATDLMEAAEDSDPAVRVEALCALAAIGDISAVPIFESALTTLEGEELERVRSLYLRLGEALLLNKERGAARRIYVNALGMGTTWKAAGLLGLGRGSLEMERERVLAALGDPESRVRGAAAEASAFLDGAEVGTALLSRLEGETAPEVRLRVLEALSFRAEPEARAAVARAAAEAKELSEREAAARFLERKDGAITSWWILGPVPAPGGVLGPEADLGPEETKDPSVAPSLGGKPWKWAHAWSTGPRGLFDLERVPGFGVESSLAFFWAEVRVPSEVECTLEFTSAEWGTLWLGGRRVHSSDARRTLADDPVKLEAKLSAGANVLLIRIARERGAWGAGLRITDRTGKPLAFLERLP